MVEGTKSLPVDPWVKGNERPRMSSYTDPIQSYSIFSSKSSQHAIAFITQGLWQPETPRFSMGRHFTPRILGNVWRFIISTQGERKYPLHQVGRGNRCVYTSYKVQHSPPPPTNLAQNVIGADFEKSRSILTNYNALKISKLLTWLSFYVYTGAYFKSKFQLRVCCMHCCLHLSVCSIQIFFPNFIFWQCMHTTCLPTHFRNWKASKKGSCLQKNVEEENETSDTPWKT